MVAIASPHCLAGGGVEVGRCAFSRAINQRCQVERNLRADDDCRAGEQQEHGRRPAERGLKYRRTDAHQDGQHQIHERRRRDRAAAHAAVFCVAGPMNEVAVTSVKATMI